MAAKTFMKKKMDKKMKEEFLKSLREKDEDEDEETGITTVNNSTEVIEVINRYEEIIKTQHK